MGEQANRDRELANKMNAHRQKRLETVFAELDYDDSGSIEDVELLELGRARQTTGQKQRDWSPDRNRRLVKKMDTDGDGLIGKSEFVHYFSESLPREKALFETVIQQFREVAEAVRKRKQQQEADVAAADALEAAELRRQQEDAATAELLRRRQEEQRQQQQQQADAGARLAVEEQANRDREHANKMNAHRQKRLETVFAEFDYDDSGSIEDVELLELGRARQTTGQKQRDWSPDRNRRLVKKMDTDGDGLIGKSEFVHYFSESLPREKALFEAVIQQFLEVAEAVRKRKQQQEAVPAVEQEVEEANPLQAVAPALGLDNLEFEELKTKQLVHQLQLEELHDTLKQYRLFLAVLSVCA